ncbi:hypothetical protein FA13DRAFT_1021093 [Coprinellus micaceus]|uniref:Uncharacterized protein n=1 Tax=Coprinellus micaceus TaxID=71717 RepID=A0A4Y7SXI1_COPMI|nr:hypothetical protein FA13DRAFT_1021093 [Coprinellus micaceus]
MCLPWSSPLSWDRPSAGTSTTPTTSLRRLRRQTRGAWPQTMTTTTTQHFGPTIGYRADGIDAICDSANFSYPLMPSAALSYARRPSGTNTHSTVPQPSHRSSSGAPPSSRRHHVRGAPRSVPNPSSASTTSTDDSEFSDELDSEKFSLKSTSSKRQRKRDSLPSYFSLLKITSPSSGSLKASPVLSSSGNTVAHLSPPTPKIIHPAPFPKGHDSARGRRRVTEESQCTHRSDASSPSRSRSRHIPLDHPRAFRGRAMPERELDAEPRGRSTMRRNSSPRPTHTLDVERSTVVK